MDGHWRFLDPQDRQFQDMRRLPMSGDPTFITLIVFMLASLGICGLACFVLMKTFAHTRRVISRLRDLRSEQSPAPSEAPPESARRRGLSGSIMPAIGSVILRGQEKRVAYLETQFVQAGLLKPYVLPAFFGVKLLLMVSLAILGGLCPYLCGLVSWRWVPFSSLFACSVGMFAPNAWLYHRVKKRQALLGSAIPDALDMLVLCMEGGVSFPAAFQRVIAELQIIHPVLGAELNIVQREIELGLSAGEALKQMGERCGLEEVRDLASLILQAEFSGASVVKALRTHADCSRQERHERASETAQKAAVKVLFPTLLFIFPAIFVVLLGPAAFQIARMFTR
jgi:tight adherence protein C